jgi:hypothetical protein
MTTTIIDDETSINPLIVASVPYGQTLTIGQMNIEAESSTTLTSPIVVAGTCTSSGCPSVRIDNINFTNWPGGTGNDAWMIRAMNVFGVIDHNSITGDIALANVHHSSYLGVGQYGDNSWVQPDSFGTANALYFENNSVNGGYMQDCDEADSYADAGGCRIVVRYNTYSNMSAAMAYFHGTDTTGRPRGGRQAEVYGNTTTCSSTTTGCPYGAIELRSGVALVYGNTFNALTGSWFTNLVGVDIYRRWETSTPWLYCAGNGQWDTNDGVVYDSGTYNGTTGSQVLTDTTKSWTINQWVASGDPYSFYDVTQGFGEEIGSNTATTITSYNEGSRPETFTAGDSYQILRASVCIDQPGRSGGTLLSGNPPATGSVGEVLDPVYEWMNTQNGNQYQPNINSGTQALLPNRDFYMESKNQAAQTSTTSPFDGTSGNGHGTLANRPSGCTTGVGYWATDQNELYVCKTTDTWTAVYSPYTYPHPLTQAAGPPAPPTNIKAVAH